MIRKIQKLLLITLLCPLLYAPAHAAAPLDYRLAPRDLVALKVFRQPDLDVTQRVDSSGQISVPLVGNMKIAGLTTRDAESLIAQAFVEGQFLRDPQVSLAIEEYAPRGVSVIGEVKQPGFVQFDIERGTMDIREVIAQSGGFTSVARKGDITVKRRMPSGQEVIFRVDFDDLMRRRDSPGFLVHDGDVINVPDRIF